MFKIMKGVNKINAESFLNVMDNDRTRGHGLRVKKRTVRTVQYDIGLSLGER